MFHSIGHRKSLVHFQYMSDLHLEIGSRYIDFRIPPVAPYLILAGDIGRLIDYEKYLEFLRLTSRGFRHVYLVLGNHEFYGLSRAEGLKAAEALQSDDDLRVKLTILNRVRANLNSEVTVLGCTLQSHITPESRAIVESKINDFRKIKDWTVDNHNAEHARDVQWLQSEIQSISRENPNQRILVITHHAPSYLNTSDPAHLNNAWSSAFCTDLIESQLPSWPGSSSVKSWVFGHTHWTITFQFGKTILASNQRGYVLLPPLDNTHSDSQSIFFALKTRWKSTSNIKTISYPMQEQKDSGTLIFAKQQKHEFNVRKTMKI